MPVSCDPEQAALETSILSVHGDEERILGFFSCKSIFSLEM